MLTFGSLFDGIGCFTLGLVRAGLTPAWLVEIKPDCRRVTAARFPGVPQFADVRECGTANLAPVDVIVGGFPCQDLSVAGNRAGMKRGNRSGLWWEMLRVVTELQPRVLVWENVPGLLSSDGGRDILRVVCSLAEHDYFGCVRCLDARYFGVAQRRRRLFGVFLKGSAAARRACEILAVREGRERHPPKGREAGARVAASLRSRSANPGVNGPGRGGEDDHNLITAYQGTGGGAERAASLTLASSDDNGSNQVVVGALQSHTKEHGHAMTTQQAAEAGHLIAGTLNCGTGTGGFRTEPGEHIVTTPAVTPGERRASGNRGGENVVVTHTLRAEGCDAGEGGTGRGTPLAVVPLDMRQASRGETMTNNRSETAASGGSPGTGIGEEGDPAPSLTETHTPAVAFNWQSGGSKNFVGAKEGHTDALGCNQTPAVAYNGQAEFAEGRGPHTQPAEVAKCIDGRGGNPDCQQGGTVVAFMPTHAPPPPAFMADAVAFKESQSGTREGGIHATLDANKGSRRVEGVREGMVVRRLTPVECLRLHGLPDDWLDLDPPLSDSAKYRMIGNGGAVPVMEWIGKRIRTVIDRRA